MTDDANDPPRETDEVSHTRALVEKVRQGDRERFTELFERTAPAVYAWANLRVPGKLRNAIDPQDVVQEVWCRALLRFAEFDPARGGFRRWLFGIATNVLLEAFRSLRDVPRARADGSSESGFRPEYVPAEATAVSQRVARNLELSAFLHRISMLGADDRELIILRGLQELTHEQVAVHLGIGEKAAQKRWVRLRDRLRTEGLPPDLLVA